MGSQKETLPQDEIPEYPFFGVGLDMCHWQGREYLVMYDGYSNYLTVQELENKSVREAIVKLQKTFGEVGYPTTTRADNSPFNNYEFREFAREYNIKVVF